MHTHMRSKFLPKATHEIILKTTIRTEPKRINKETSYTLQHKNTDQQNNQLQKQPQTLKFKSDSKDRFTR